MKWVYDDGGRSKYFRGITGDCSTRAIAIATETDYKQVYDELFKLSKSIGDGRSPRNGVPMKVIKTYLSSIGWEWHPTVKVGSGCKVHLDERELPSGRVICRVSKHLTAVIDGTCHDTYDCTRDGTRCVYGYWFKRPKIAAIHKGM